MALPSEPSPSLFCERRRRCHEREKEREERRRKRRWGKICAKNGHGLASREREQSGAHGRRRPPPSPETDSETDNRITDTMRNAHFHFMFERERKVVEIALCICRTASVLLSTASRASEHDRAKIYLLNPPLKPLAPTALWSEPCFPCTQVCRCMRVFVRRSPLLPYRPWECWNAAVALNCSFDGRSVPPSVDNALLRQRIHNSHRRRRRRRGLVVVVALARSISEKKKK